MQAVRHGVGKLRSPRFRSRCRRPGTVSVKKSLDRRRGLECARVGREDNQAKCASACVLRGRSADYPRGDAHAGRALRGLNASYTLVRSRNRRPGRVLVKKSLDRRRGLKRAPRWLRKQPRQVRQRARAPWASSRFFMGQSAHGTRGTAFRGCGHAVRNHSRRPGAVSVKKSFVQRRGVECARVGREYNLSKTASARAPWVVGRFFSWRSARGPCATGLVSYGHANPKPQPPIWRGVGGEES